MNINKLETVLSTKKDLTESMLKAKKVFPQPVGKSLVNGKTTEAILTAEKHVAKMASSPKYAELFKSASKKLAAPKNLNIGYFTSNIKKLAK